MTSKRTTRTLFKKLSALRACLSDNERALLDKLVLTQINTTELVGNSNGESESDITIPDAAHQADNNEIINIRFDKDQEIYIVD